MKTKALFDAKRLIAQIVTDVVNLEDINYTVPEVQTLLDGITVGGHKLQDELITLNQIKAWQFLFASIEQGEFVVSKDYLLRLHALVANQEALSWGEFRTGQVSISGTDYLPPKHDKLDLLWSQLAEDVNNKLAQDFALNQKEPMAADIYAVAIHLFGQMARTQFFFDGNKRTARMMMSGILLSHGLPMINVPAKRKLEFNQMMIDYYNTEQFDPLLNFMLSCIPDYIKEEYNLKV
ncbi:MAG TPA: Fic family protein [Burkholderiales bacterium]|nr:Fic family protein [Burkholderiales bacterium]